MAIQARVSRHEIGMLVHEDHNWQAIKDPFKQTRKNYPSIYIPVTGAGGARGAQTIPNNERSDSRSCGLDNRAWNEGPHEDS